MVFVWVWLASCSVFSPPPELARTQVREVVEAFDVPPPPEQRTLRLRLEAPGTWELGEALQIFEGDAPVAVGDLVDVGRDPPRLTVYLPEEAADAVLDGQALSVRTAAAPPM